MLFPEYVKELREIYKKHDMSLALAPGCTENALKETQTLLGFPLERGLRYAWQIADGSKLGVRVFSRPGFSTGYDFLSLASALEERDSMRQVADQYEGYVEDKPRDRRIRPGWFHDGWLPFAGFGGGILLLIQDYSPAETGNMGQIIAFTHDPDKITYVAPDFHTFLEQSLSWIKNDPEEFLEIF
jgi:cell wall assembly regulator SMI1